MKPPAILRVSAQRETCLLQIRVNNSLLQLQQGDITESNADAIVNAANSNLILGAGVAGAIRKKGGPSIQEECDRIGSCPVGNAAITRAGNLNARFVIHAVGPRWGEGHEVEKLKNAILNSLRRAEEKELKSIAFPAISTGIFGFPLELAAETLLKTVLQYLSKKTIINTVTFILFDAESFNIFKDTLAFLEKEEI
ncbi:MAG: O-acetyl-ADP-ribose deacetylase [Nitrospinae bacterium CG22_combo_CG10-13_8_21_14_all_47_10]|nr:MAG: O-acetyl-ADP-ribose deacetylase [Nitrospinae bacterium CG22_combo_CG10-13_8_21_14_all_47_10]